MPQWANSDRRDRLPKDWPQIRRRVLKRDGGRCTERNDYGQRCPELATDVDHVKPGDDHSLSNLRSLCSWHHNRKSGAEGAQARAAIRRRNGKKFKRTENHPGLL